ncbi:hypothetical protein YC2023_074954 [Brassica napus]
MYKITDHPFLIRFISLTIIDEVIKYAHEINLQSRLDYLWWERNDRLHRGNHRTPDLIIRKISSTIKNRISALRPEHNTLASCLFGFSIIRVLWSNGVLIKSDSGDSKFKGKVEVSGNQSFSDLRQTLKDFSEDFSEYFRQVFHEVFRKSSKVLCPKWYKFWIYFSDLNKTLENFSEILGRLLEDFLGNL